MLTKQELRKIYLANRAALSPVERRAADASLRERLRSLPAYRNAAAVVIYASDGTEPDLLPLLDSDSQKRFYLPRFEEKSGSYIPAQVRCANELVTGKYGIAEPPAQAPCADGNTVRTALYCVPLVAFDKQGTRLGRGKGFYDRMLEKVSGPVMGIAYDRQFAEVLPKEPHDCALSGAVTETHLFDFVQQTNMAKEN